MLRRAKTLSTLGLEHVEYARLATLVAPGASPQIVSLPTAEAPMAAGKTATVDDYIAEQPVNRRAVVSAVRDLVRRNLPKGYTETTNGKLINYEVPLERYPTTYNGRPLSYIAFAPQKNYYALYLMGVYQNAQLQKDLATSFKRAGKKLDMGKSCLRFKKLEDLELDAVARAIASTPPEKFIEDYEATRRGR